MRIIILESQYKRLFEQDEQKILTVPGLKYFGSSWDNLLNFLKKKGYPPYIISDNLDLSNSEIESLGNLQSVGGYLDLRNTPIESLGNLTSVGGNLDLRGAPIKSLGNLTSVEGDLSLSNTPIESLGNLTSVGGYLVLLRTPIESLGNLTSVGGNLYLRNTPISKKYSEQEIRQMVNVDGEIII